jgi:hypothetical protein
MQYARYFLHWYARFSQAVLAQSVGSNQRQLWLRPWSLILLLGNMNQFREWLLQILSSISTHGRERDSVGGPQLRRTLGVTLQLLIKYSCLDDIRREYTSYHFRIKPVQCYVQWRLRLTYSSNNVKSCLMTRFSVWFVSTSKAMEPIAVHAK